MGSDTSKMEKKINELQGDINNMRKAETKATEDFRAKEKKFEQDARAKTEESADRARRAEAAAKEREHELLLQQKDQAMQMAAKEHEAQLEMKNMELKAAREIMELQMLFEQKKLEHEAKYAKEMQALKDAAVQMEKELEDASDPDQYEKVQDSIFQKFLSKVETIPPPEKMERPSVAVMGRNGVGKSSLINAMAGQEVTKVDYVDCTKEVSMVFGSPTTDFYDVPGCNDRRSYCNLEHIMKVKTMHLILICYSERVEQIIKLEEMVAACKVPYLVVRTKMDHVDPGADRKRMWDTEKKEIKGPLVYTSTRSGEGMDLLKTQAKEVSGIQL